MTEPREEQKPDEQNSASPPCSTAADAHWMMRTRERLAASRSQRQRAVAEFPLRVVSVANDLRKLCDMRDSGAVMSDDSHEAMRYLEDQIRLCYREMFGAELGQ